MPYTFAHLGYSIGLKKKYFNKLSSNGLLMGSITPDFDILFKTSNPRLHIFFFDLFSIFVVLIPLTLLLSLFFHFSIRNSIIDSLPDRISNSLSKYKSYDYWNFLKQNFSIEVFSILIALIVHFSLDYISHWNAFTYLMIIHVGIYPCRFLIPFHYYFGWYFPQIVATALGFYILYIYLSAKGFTIQSIIKDIYNSNYLKKLIWVSFIIISILFALLKLILLGYEKGEFAWHSIIIYFTSGLIFSFFFSPLVAKIILKKVN